ncbi:MAG: hypothetical protein WC325_07815 [Candidatus Bathyarchaeia archaeon]|jgi:hypothetical protein
MGDENFSVYLFFLQLVACYLIVVLFLLVMLVIVGHAPISILFNPYGLVLQAILVAYCWLILFLVKPKKTRKQNPQ